MGIHCETSISLFGKFSFPRARSIPFVSGSESSFETQFRSMVQNHGSSSRYLNTINLVEIYMSLSRLSILIYDDKKYN